MKKRRNKTQNTWLLMFIAYILTMGIAALVNLLNIYLVTASFLLLLLIFKKYKNWREKRYLKATFKVIDKMSGEEFEEFLEVHYKRLGYKTFLTPLTADYGADIIIKKSGEKIVVQAKRWNQHVGIEAVQQAVGSVKYYKADSAMVVTNNYFTENARNLAKANDVTLIDRNSLLTLMNREEGKCPVCNGSLRVVSGKYGDFFGCTNYPKCKYTKKL
ncbi:restriction endonuclease [Clostridium paraputrificum]|uniref:restriction endonuclease n=1 Tax=Clostridium TaxID=1485 RepID=UPI003D356A97